MNISLTPELESFIKEKVNLGLYTSASEVVRESLRLMHSYEDIQKQAVARAVDLGVSQLNKNEYVDGESSRQRIKDKIRKMDTTAEGKK